LDSFARFLPPECGLFDRSFHRRHVEQRFAAKQNQSDPLPVVRLPDQETDSLASRFRAEQAPFTSVGSPFGVTLRATQIAVLGDFQDHCRQGNAIGVWKLGSGPSRPAFRQQESGISQSGQNLPILLIRLVEIQGWAGTQPLDDLSRLRIDEKQACMIDPEEDRSIADIKNSMICP
jgi:hypothetical protein